MYDPELIELPPNVGMPALNEPPNRRESLPALLAKGMELGLEDWRKIWAAHLGLVTYSDDLLGGVIERLKRTGRYENTVALFTTDHGEHLGQHDMYQKHEMYDQCIRVPLIIKCPGINSVRFDGAVSHLDVLPTLCELMELPKPERLDGISLVPAMAGGEADENRSVFGQYIYCKGPGLKRRGMFNMKWKYSVDEFRDEELYDMQSDVHEERNLAGNPEYSAILADMAAKCRQYHESRGDVYGYNYKVLFFC